MTRDNFRHIGTCLFLSRVLKHPAILVQSIFKLLLYPIHRSCVLYVSSNYHGRFLLVLNLGSVAPLRYSSVEGQPTNVSRLGSGNNQFFAYELTQNFCFQLISLSLRSYPILDMYLSQLLLVLILQILSLLSVLFFIFPSIATNSCKGTVRL